MNNLVDEESKKLFNKIYLDDNNFDIDYLINEDHKDFDVFRIFNLVNKINTKEKDTDNNIEKDARKYFSNFDISKSHIYNVSPQIKKLLINIKGGKLEKDSTYNLPFDDIFIDNLIAINDNIVFLGFRLVFPMSRDLTKVVFGRDDLFYIQTFIFHRDFGVKFYTFTYSLTKGLVTSYNETNNAFKKKYGCEFCSKIDFKKFTEFITNLILFFNEPRVTIHIHTHNNGRRIKKGKIPIPSQITTYLHYTLKDYVEKIYYDGSSTSRLGYAFWVRGHNRRLLSPRYKEQKIIWIKPHLKGEGLQPLQVHKIVE